MENSNQSTRFVSQRSDGKTYVANAHFRPCSGQRPLKLYNLSVHPLLGTMVSKHLGIPLEPLKVGKFANGETRVEALQSCRGSNCFIIQPICNNVDKTLTLNDALMELLVATSALKMASARSITVVTPVFGYARQDKKMTTRTSITARLVADLLQTAGADRIMTIELHASQIEGFFSVPVDNLYGEKLLLEDMRRRYKDQISVGDIVIVSPDAGGASRATRVSGRLNTDCAIISKERLQAGVVNSMRLVGTVEGKVAILVDDMADSCGTLCKAAKLLMENGAVRVLAYVVHGVFSGPAIERLNNSVHLDGIVCTNTMPQTKNLKACPKLSVLDVSELVGRAIEDVWKERSLLASL